MPDIDITSVRTHEGGVLEIHGRSPASCSTQSLDVTATVLGQIEASYHGSVTVDSTVNASGYQTWIVWAQITTAYRTSPDKIDPPCDLEITVVAKQGDCITKTHPEPIHVFCCASIDLREITVSRTCNSDGTRTVTVNYTINRRNAAGDVGVIVVLSSADDSAPYSSSDTCALDVYTESRDCSATFRVPTPPVNQTRNYACVLELSTAGKCADDTRETRPVEVPGCPCPPGPTGALTLHEAIAPYEALVETTLDGIACVDRKQVRVVAPDYPTDPPIVWTNARPVPNTRAAIVNLPANGTEVAVVARLGTDPCSYTLPPKVLRRCARQPPCPTITDMRFEHECMKDGTDSVTFSVTTAPPDATGTYTWDFGDGSANETSTIPAKTHPYHGGGGTFLVRVTLKPDDPNCPAAPPFEKGVSLQPCSQPPCDEPTDLLRTNQVCVANADGAINGAVLATFVVTTTPANALGTYSWDFGDSAPETTQVPTRNHTYSEGGTKTVKVTLTPQDKRCPAKTVERELEIKNCEASKPTTNGGMVVDQCCLFLMIISFMVLAVGAFLLPMGLCALFSQVQPVGIVLTIIGAILLVVGFVMFLIWLLWCATIPANCLLVDVLLALLGTLGTLLAIVGIIVAIVDVVLVVLAYFYGISLAALPCGIGVVIGVCIDWAEFWFIYAIAYWFAVAVGCVAWPRFVPASMRPTLPAWLTTALDGLRAKLPGCPL